MGNTSLLVPPPNDGWVQPPDSPYLPSLVFGNSVVKLTSAMPGVPITTQVSTGLLRPTEQRAQQVTFVPTLIAGVVLIAVASVAVLVYSVYYMISHQRPKGTTAKVVDDREGQQEFLY